MFLFYFGPCFVSSVISLICFLLKPFDVLFGIKHKRFSRLSCLLYFTRDDNKCDVLIENYPCHPLIHFNRFQFFSAPNCWNFLFEFLFGLLLLLRTRSARRLKYCYLLLFLLTVNCCLNHCWAIEIVPINGLLTNLSHIDSLFSKKKSEKIIKKIRISRKSKCFEYSVTRSNAHISKIASHLKITL